MRFLICFTCSLPCFMMFQVFRPKSTSKVAKGFKGSKGELLIAHHKARSERKLRNQVKARSKKSKLSQERNTHHQGISRLIPGTEECFKAQKEALGSQKSKPMELHTGNALRSQTLKARSVWATSGRAKPTHLALTRLQCGVVGPNLVGYLVLKFTCSPDRKSVV